MDELFVANGDITIGATAANLDEVGAIEPHDGGRPPIVFVHGWPELSHSWRHQMAHFAAAGFPCVALDVRGYGRSSCPPEIERYTHGGQLTDRHPQTPYGVVTPGSQPLHFDAAAR